MWPAVKKRDVRPYLLEGIRDSITMIPRVKSKLQVPSKEHFAPLFTRRKKLRVRKSGFRTNEHERHRKTLVLVLVRGRVA
jgi:hypothetical protein